MSKVTYAMGEDSVAGSSMQPVLKAPKPLAIEGHNRTSGYVPGINSIEMQPFVRQQERSPTRLPRNSPELIASAQDLLEQPHGDRPVPPLSAPSAPNVSIPDSPILDSPPVIPESSIPESPEQPLENQQEQPLESPTEPEIDLEQVVLDTLTSTSERYPHIVNSTDNLTFLPQSFRPNADETYGSFDFRFAQQNPVLNRLTIARFPQSNQFYWIVEGNRVVAETEGWQGGVLYQGQSDVTHTRERVELQQVLWGTQAVWNIPRPAHLGVAEPENFSVTTVSGAIINSPGTPAGRIILNSGIDVNAPNVTRLTDLIPNISDASTYSPTGGADLFQSLSPDEAPLILQGFPTVDLSPLIDHGNVQLRQGEVIPTDVLSRAGISWGDIFTGEPSSFTAPVTSTSGIKIAQLTRFGNRDLLGILVNPNLRGTERDLSYLNSLFWTSFGRRQPEFELLSQNQNTEDWYRAYLSHTHNRVAIDYDPVDIRATYTNIFANPGVSVVLALNGGIDTTQTLNATLGLLLGGLFEEVDLNNIDRSLEEARQAFDNRGVFSSLSTQATSTQRRQINQRLNQTLAYTNFTSGLEQVSGGITFPSSITPNTSNLFRLQTGLYRRSVQFLHQKRHVIVGDTFISNLRLSNRTFGPLTFIGSPTTDSSTPIQPTNEAFAVDVILTGPGGEQFVQQYNSADVSANPLMVRGADLTFDRIELTRIDHVETEFDSFRGYLSLPAIEMTWVGSSNDFNYSLSSGLWLNLNANEAPGVSHNSLGLPEPTIGIYANAVLNLSTTDITLDSNNNPVSASTYGPLLRMNWDSTSRFFTALSYAYSHQERNWRYSLTPGIAIAVNSDNTQRIVFLNGDLVTASGLELSGGLELSENTFFNVQVIQSVNPRLSVGAYIQNFSSDSEGLETRSLNLNYGALLRYTLNGNNRSTTIRIGTGDRGLDARIQGEFQF
ncbi:hypothetical protein IQ268_29235 [Oculatella sp. LEGE 06141]|uniref:hypothetical protein n=1 Tax=Oculatella sp. LEGE 06141 TaxID=1828648 RepID=UPI0018816589|nr:hypothetical protein [Oculatella sp. LEGE 06141]MBE9182626.1 hypothetical protein [Oculatella sp. LEGE 06141]